MNIEDQVCSPELSHILKNFEVKQESYFVWVRNILIPRLSAMELDQHAFFQCLFSAAFTSAELGEMLPEEVDTLSW